MVVLLWSLQRASYTYAVIYARGKIKINAAERKRAFQFGTAANFPVSFAGDAEKECGGVPFRDANGLLGLKKAGPESRSAKLLTFATGCYTAKLSVVF
jgi:hypothetical protein